MSEAPVLLGKAPVCILLLCGVPAAGKTTLAGEMLASWPIFAPDVAIKHICFDRIAEAMATDEPGSTWKMGRMSALALLEGEIKKPLVNQRRLLLVDDNMYYRSMRREVFQLARNHRTEFIQMFLKVSADEALKRNAERANPLPDGVIVDMCSKFEPPEQSRSFWEKKTIELDSRERNADFAENLWKAVNELWQGPVSIFESPEAVLERKASGQASNAKSVLHQLDNRTRKVIANTISQLRDASTPSEVISCTVMEMNKRRKQLLEACRDRMRMHLLDTGIDVLETVAEEEERFTSFCASYV